MSGISSADTLRLGFPRGPGQGAITDARGETVGFTSCVEAVMSEGTLRASRAIRDLNGDPAWVIEQHGQTMDPNCRFLVFDSGGAATLGVIVGGRIWRSGQAVATIRPRGLLRRTHHVVIVESGISVAQVEQRWRRPGQLVSLTSATDAVMRKRATSVAFIMFSNGVERRVRGWE